MKKMVVRDIFLIAIMAHIIRGQFNFPIQASLFQNRYFRDCYQGCNFSSKLYVSSNQTIGYVSLPSTFKISFEYVVQANLAKPGNIIDIYSLTYNSSLLSVYLGANSNKISVYYMGNIIINSGISIVQSLYDAAKLTVSVDYLSVTISNGIDPYLRVPIGPAAVSSSKNIIYASNIVADNIHISAGGILENIKIDGPICCSSTAYRQSELAQCMNAADYTADIPFSSCSACVSYQCIDWAMGSTGMRQREDSYTAETGDRVYFAVGSYGNVPNRGGLCYRLQIPNSDRDIIAQVITSTQGPTSAGHFKVLVGDGGLGYADACTPESTSIPQYPGSANFWGPMYGGAVNRTSCERLPAYPVCGAVNQDNLKELCHWPFDKGLRMPNSSAVPIAKMCVVKCPSQLYEATGILRTDEPADMNCAADSGSTVYNGQLATYMDCGSPTYTLGNAVKGALSSDFPAVMPCRRDGYTRINSFPEPTTAPISVPPTEKPTFVATSKPSSAAKVVNPMCCASFSYASYQWNQCFDPSSPTLGHIASCSTCVSYFCLDWLPGSYAMSERESLYFNNTGDPVYFGVGAYGFEASRGGLCYRLTVESVEKDIIVQVIDQAGSGVDGNFDIFLAGGGLGDQNACTYEGSSLPQFLSVESQWGDTYGGWPTKEQCSNLPEYPACGSGTDNLRRMCEWSFEHGFRLAPEFNYDNSNPLIRRMCQVECPAELWQATGIRRADEQVQGYSCSTNPEPTGGRLSRKMDCAKPYFASPYKVGAFFDGHSVAVACKRDGYARINSIPTAPPTISPTEEPSASSQPILTPSVVVSKAPTRKPSPQPSTRRPSLYSTATPTQDVMCCADTKYAEYVWPYCNNAVYAKRTVNTTCENTCLSYQCLDWTLLSSGMQERERSYSARTQDSVYFGVGSYGNVGARAGNCYRMTLDGVDRDLVAQVISMGGNSPDGNFNILMADGGFSDEYNACTDTNTDFPQFVGSSSDWGGQGGGWLNITGCDAIPEYPACGPHRDSLRSICKELFYKGFRRSNYAITNPTITQMCQVSCPKELWQATGLRRADEPISAHQCSASIAKEPAGGILSRSMDCARPSYSWEIKDGVTYSNHSVVIPCRRDGYTRVNEPPGPLPTLSPSIAPSTEPSIQPTVRPTVEASLHPSLSEMCCEYTVYGSKSVWQGCNSAANPSLGVVNTCDMCLSYQCLDWTAGSNAMQQRERSFLQNSGINVYFGVGSYSNDPTRGGQCYRMSIAGIDRDVIAQVVNMGAMAADGNFQIVLADGGFEFSHACAAGAGANVPQFPGSAANWGDNFGFSGGWASIDDCSNLPEYPVCAINGSDSLIDMCKWSFSKGFRHSGTNARAPVINSMCQVKCPQELYQATGLHRLDEPNSEYFCVSPSNLAKKGSLQKGMDCAKPSYAWKSNVKGVVDPDYSVVIPCRRDGYTRVNVIPKNPPTFSPSGRPTVATLSPSVLVVRNVTYIAGKSPMSVLDQLTKTSRGLIILVVCGFVLLIILAVTVCEMWLRRTRRRELRDRAVQRMLMNSTRGVATKKGEYLKSLASAADSINASGLSYSEYLEITNSLLQDDNL